MEDRNTTIPRANAISDVVFERVLDYIHDSRDRQSISLVCRRLYELESHSRKHVSIPQCYTATPKQLLRRFPFLESVKLKGQPRTQLVRSTLPDCWGGFATPWVEEFSKSFGCLKAVHFRRMVVKDEDLELLARERGGVLEVLKLDICSGFSTDGLAHISRSCRKLKVLFLEGSLVVEKDGDWLHELAINNTQLETLNFYFTKLSLVSSNDLELIAERCKSLKSVKISDCERLDLDEFFYLAGSLEEFRGNGFHKFVELYPPLPSAEFDPPFPPGLCRLGPNGIDIIEIYLVGRLASRLKQLDFLYTYLDTDDQCMLLEDCHNLEVLETGLALGDPGMEVVANCCKKLKRIRIEPRPGGEWWEGLVPDEDEDEDEEPERVVTQRGLTAIAQGCLDLEYICVFASNITNAALESIGTNLKKLRDFRIVLLATEEVNKDFPLDSGIRSLLSGCNNLRRLSLSLRPGGLTDVGLTYIGQHSPNIKCMQLQDAGESDAGLLGFSKGCPSLRKLQLTGCCFSEKALAMAVLQLRSLRYLWVEEYMGYKTGSDLLAMARPFWNIEIMPPSEVLWFEKPANILAYYSLAGPRTDYPSYVSLLDSIAQ
ncbi:hypothetical protein SSX86_017819 [Deinandra increscens subsp. villosa]|uniref:Uncharacterized protein n=1 Tax=Deinandra increscens subsp. villosa TaxID=3103831 RepID=A0AAP0D189_9ASTR